MDSWDPNKNWITWTAAYKASIDPLFTDMLWPHFWAIQIIPVVLILNYCMTRALVGVIGADKFRAMFFGPPASARI